MPISAFQCLVCSARADRWPRNLAESCRKDLKSTILLAEARHLGCECCKAFSIFRWDDGVGVGFHQISGNTSEAPGMALIQHLFSVIHSVWGGSAKIASHYAIYDMCTT